MEQFSTDKTTGIKALAEIGLYYQFKHRPLLVLKEYPYDVKTIAKFIVATLIPVGISAIELALR